MIMRRRDLKSRLNRLLENPADGSVKKSKQAKLSDLRARLEKFESKKKSSDPPAAGAIKKDNRDKLRAASGREYVLNRQTYENDILSLPSVGDIIDSEGKGFSVWENRFAPDHPHGEILLNSIRRIEHNVLGALSYKQDFSGFDTGKALFIDTETTGLAGGTGTLAFLIGLGYHTEDGFVVRQYFMRDFSEEAAALEAISRFASNFRYLVSFNGRGYDLPILQSRFILNRIDIDLSSFPHLDLLFPSRMVFKHRLDDCRLTTLERQVIHFFREDDVPSQEIPELYFKYLRSRNPALMDRVFYHNTMDVVSLSALTTKLSDLIQADKNLFEYGEDLYGVARFHFRLGNWAYAEQCYRNATEYDLPYELRFKLLAELSLVLKKAGKLEEAAEIWKGMIEGMESFDYFPYEELAKYYEHRKKSFRSAVSIVRHAIDALNNASEHIEKGLYLRWQDMLFYRLHRLEKRLKGKHWR